MQNETTETSMLKQLATTFYQTVLIVLPRILESTVLDMTDGK